MLNRIWTGFFLIAALTALYHGVVLGDTDVLNRIMAAIFSMAETGFTISIGLTGVMTLWLGIMRIGESGGAVALISRMLNPFFRIFFPDIPANHPAQGAMVMNIAANMLGLDNAATPLGLKAMHELQKLNPEKERASDAQVMFLVINTSSVTLIPVTIFTYLYQLKYPNPTELFLPILLATSCSTMAGLLAVSIVQRINLLTPKVLLLLVLLFSPIAAISALFLSLDQDRLQQVSLVASNSILFGLIIIFMILALFKRVNIYDEFINGAREGFSIAISIIPYLVAMLVAIGVFRASGALDLFLFFLESLFRNGAEVLQDLGILIIKENTFAFIDALPTGLMKPLSGSGARGLMIETIQIHGVDALASKMAAVMQGSTETTFYVLAVYFGAIGVKNSRHAIPCGLIADGVGITAAIVVTYLFFG